MEHSETKRIEKFIRRNPGLANKITLVTQKEEMKQIKKSAQNQKMKSNGSRSYMGESDG